MDQQTFIIEFEGVSKREANQYAEELRDTLKAAEPDVSVEQSRDSESSMDFGASLILILGTPAVIAVAKAFGDWLKRHHEVEVKIKTPNGEVVAKNLTAKEAYNITELLRKKM
jgi:hypothetical protein